MIRKKKNCSGNAVNFRFKYERGVRAEETEPEEFGPAGDLWIEVADIRSYDRISVTVPLVYAFVVVGSTEAEDTDSIRYENGNLILPTAEVEVAEDGTPGTNDPYTLWLGEESLEGDSVPHLVLKNYSTAVSEEYGEGDDGENVINREGLGVKVTAFMTQSVGSDEPASSERAYWQLTGEEPSTAEEGFKKFRFILDETPFSTSDDYTEPEADTYQVFWLEGDLRLPGPGMESGWTTGGYANNPQTCVMPIEVQVGGMQNHYTQIEESVKVADIHWFIEADLN